MIGCGKVRNVNSKIELLTMGSFKEYVNSFDTLAIDEAFAAELEQELALNEGVTDVLKKVVDFTTASRNFMKNVTALFLLIKKSSDRKSRINDQVFGKLYHEELLIFSERFALLPENVKVVVEKILNRYKIKLSYSQSGVNLDRNFTVKFLIVKVLNLVLSTAEVLVGNQKQDFILSCLTGNTFLTILSAIFNFEDMKTLYNELKRVVVQISTVYKAAEAQRVKQQNQNPNVK